jgi:hypothetical protein
MRTSSRLSIVLMTSAMAACTTYSGVETTPTFTRARLVSEPPKPAASAFGAPKPLAAERPARQRPPRLSGARAVYQATKQATIDPTDVSMHGAAWVIDDIDETRIYRVPTRLERVTTILLPEGEQINKITGGNVDGFLVEASYAGSRPAISVLPAYPEAGTNIAVSTTGGLYGFQLCVYQHSWTPVVDVRRPEPAALPARANVPVPQGQFDRLHMQAPEDRPLPAWAPAEAWADALRLVIRFRAPLPVLPGLYAGQEGEQVVSYRALRTGDTIYMVTSRRVTEAELRLDTEIVQITATPQEVHQPAAVLGQEEAWRAAGLLPAPATDALQPLAAFDSGGME